MYSSFLKFVFNKIDLIFLKLGKPIARNIAKKDKTDDIFLKRENQSKLIIKTAIKGMIKYYTIPYFFSSRIFLSFLFFVPCYLAYILITIYNQKYISNIYAYKIIIITMLIVLNGIFIINSLEKAINLIQPTRYFYYNNMIHVIKNYEYRRKAFHNINIIHLFSILLILISLSLKDNFIFLNKVSISMYIFSSLIMFSMWSFNYLMMAVIYHCDDIGKKQKEKDKKKNFIMFPDTV